MAAVKDMPFLAIDVLIRCSYDPREVVGQRERGGGSVNTYIYIGKQTSTYSAVLEIN